MASCLALAVTPTAGAAERMYIGFQDDESFRWDADRTAALDRARAAGATVVRATAHWAQLAPERPASPADPFDRAYDFRNLDDLVRNAQQRGMEVLLTLWNTPAWANGGRGGNYAPDDPAELRAFAQAIASRYSGRHAAFPFVRFFSVWNEPNVEQFLAPQFDAEGRSVAPATYARLAAAAYAGVKAGSPGALVALGETAARGRDRPAGDGVQASHSPGRFAELVARAQPALAFDAWAHHPYPPSLSAGPTRAVAWPSVPLTGLDRFGRALDLWFNRVGTPIWVSEYAHQTRPQQPAGVPYRAQARYTTQAITLARHNARVAMFIWFMLRDHAGERWQSGLVDGTGVLKPAFGSFAAMAQEVDVRNAVVSVSTATDQHVVRVPALELKWHIPTGARVGVRLTLRGCRRVMAAATPASAIESDGWVPITIRLRPQPWQRYELQLELHDVHGFRVRRTLSLIGVPPSYGPRVTARPRCPTPV